MQGMSSMFKAVFTWGVRGAAALPSRPPPLPWRSKPGSSRCNDQSRPFEGVINTLRRELAESRGEPAPAASARTDAAAAAQAAPAATTTTKRKATSTTSAAATNGTTAAMPPKTSRGWQLAGSSHSRRSQGAQEAPGAAPPIRPPVPMRVDGHRLGLPEPGAPRRVPLPVRAPTCPPLRLLAALLGAGGHQVRLGQYPHIVLWGVGGVTEGSAPPPPQQAGPGHCTYASATRSAARGFRLGALRAVAVAARTSAALPPVQPTAAALWALLPLTTAVQPLRLF